MEIRKLSTDILIIGGGTAGCYAALTIAKESDRKVLILEKANIKRSGCLAAGVNALNAYIVKGQKPEDYVNYAKRDAEGIVREDLLITMARRLNYVTKELEGLGLVILKDENGEYVARGNRNIKINGENIKPILANAVSEFKNVEVLNKVNVIDYLVKDNKIYGVYGISVDEEVFYVVEAKSVICATGGASGLYKPNNPGFSQHKMWYSPFNTGGGFAMGIRAGAEMTTFEMRFIALRCKDTIAPTGTIAQGVMAPQINSKGEDYGKVYGNTTSERVYGTVKENLEGRGPCYLKTEGISKEAEQDLLKAYLNMAPSQTLGWIESGNGPSIANVEIEGTEPYVVGGHTASGYWVDTNRATTVKGLYAVGDVAGGCPQKYVTGALVEGEIAGIAALNYIDNVELTFIDEKEINEVFNKVKKHLSGDKGLYEIDNLEEGMQTVMDKYAGGISSSYQFNEKQLELAKIKIDNIIKLAEDLKAKDMDDLLHIFELKERLVVCKVLIEHLKARKETRWHSFCENLDYPNKDDKYLKYVNSVMKDGRVNIVFRDLIDGGEIYEHSN
ncbi:adenylyl-sulfate reductase subunit alpha [Clostridium cibarium]|uniref:Adenylyl-sulfate reductase subunit alpha n=1 Tax=Clostridium cibarium TaxID=2762247 RepID=A0ABR8PT20_9CLOT|nr:adenylyl-sulfate reductase subunit alpha [Clostridium cibarium]MBD7911321.1 adenylyl-sulfate reductase subunit alpha [Clostridium cibarium]